MFTFPARKDKLESGYTVSAERVTVPAGAPYRAYLQQVPKADSVPTATFEIGGGALTKTATNPPPQPGYYHLDYSTGDLTFHAGDADKVVLYDYVGIGTLLRAGHINAIQEALVEVAGEQEALAESLEGLLDERPERTLVAAGNVILSDPGAHWLGEAAAACRVSRLLVEIEENDGAPLDVRARIVDAPSGGRTIVAAEEWVGLVAGSHWLRTVEGAGVLLAAGTPLYIEVLETNGAEGPVNATITVKGYHA